MAYFSTSTRSHLRVSKAVMQWYGFVKVRKLMCSSHEEAVKKEKLQVIQSKYCKLLLLLKAHVSFLWSLLGTLLTCVTKYKPVISTSGYITMCQDIHATTVDLRNQTVCYHLCINVSVILGTRWVLARFKWHKNGFELCCTFQGCYPNRKYGTGHVGCTLPHKSPFSEVFYIAQLLLYH